MTGKFGPASHTIMPIQIRAGVIVYLQGIPHDLTFAEAEKLVAVIRGLAMPSAAPSPDGEEVERVAEALRLAAIDWSGKPRPKEPYWQFLAAAIAAMRPTLSEEDRARVKRVREWVTELMPDIHTMSSGDADSLEDTAFLLSLIDKLAGEG